MIDKPCFWYEEPCLCLKEEGERCLRGECWIECRYGGKNEKYRSYIYSPSDFVKRVKERHKKRINQVKLKNAVAIREEVVSYINRKILMFEYILNKHEKAQLTKIIKKHL